jgi:hypothetical protein
MDLNPCSILSAILQRTFIIVSVNPALEPPDSAPAADKEFGIRRVFSSLLKPPILRCGGKFQIEWVNRDIDMDGVLRRYRKLIPRTPHPDLLKR